MLQMLGHCVTIDMLTTTIHPVYLQYVLYVLNRNMYNAIQSQIDDYSINSHVAEAGPVLVSREYSLSLVQDEQTNTDTCQIISYLNKMN